MARCDMKEVWKEDKYTKVQSNESIKGTGALTHICGKQTIGKY